MRSHRELLPRRLAAVGAAAALIALAGGQALASRAGAPTPSGSLDARVAMLHAELVAADSDEASTLEGLLGLDDEDADDQGEDADDQGDDSDDADEVEVEAPEGPDAAEHHEAADEADDDQGEDADDQGEDEAGEHDSDHADSGDEHEDHESDDSDEHDDGGD